MEAKGRPCIWALDLGTKLGWARRDRAGSITSGTSHFEGGGGLRFVKFFRWLSEAAHAGFPAAVFYEDVKAHKGTQAAHIYGGFQAIITAWCEQRRIPCHAVGVGTIKKHATGKGNAKKDKMIEAARRRGFAPADDNEADALALLNYAIWRGGVS